MPTFPKISCLEALSAADAQPQATSTKLPCALLYMSLVLPITTRHMRCSAHMHAFLYQKKNILETKVHHLRICSGAKLSARKCPNRILVPAHRLPICAETEFMMLLAPPERSTFHLASGLEPTRTRSQKGLAQHLRAPHYAWAISSRSRSGQSATCKTILLDAIDGVFILGVRLVCGLSTPHHPTSFQILIHPVVVQQQHGRHQRSTLFSQITNSCTHFLPRSTPH
jgi:hypothetical protein